MGWAESEALAAAFLLLLTTLNGRWGEAKLIHYCKGLSRCENG